MRRLTLSDLKLGLLDLLDKRRPALELTGSGRTYAPMLAQKLARITALPAAAFGGKALAAELDATDVRHDGAGKAVWHLTEAYLQHPELPEPVLAAVKRVRAAFIPAMGQLQETYADEAEAAIKRKPLVQQHTADLQMIPVAGGGTLLDWVTVYLDAGEQLHTLLSDRADASEGSRQEAGGLRSSTIGQLNRLRAALADELAHDASLPRNLDAQVFAYFDELHAPRVAAAARAKKDEPKPKDAPKPKDELKPKDEGPAKPSAGEGGKAGKGEAGKGEGAKGEGAKGEEGKASEGGEGAKGEGGKGEGAKGEGAKGEGGKGEGGKGG